MKTQENSWAPLVSVIIPAFNAAAFIDETLASVFDQTYPSIEIVVVDDGSTDTTSEILHHQEGRIVHLRQENAGQAAARNRGAEIAKGSLLCFLDADDIFNREKIEQQVGLLNQFDDAVAVYCDCRIINAAGHVIQDQSALCSLRASGDVLASFLRGHSIMTPGLVLMRRAAWVKAGGFSESRIHRGHEDGAFWLRLALEGPIVYSPETLLSYRRHDAQETQRRDRSLTISQSRVQRLVDIKDAIYARNDSDLKRLLDEQILSAGVYAAWLSRRRGDWRGAVKCAMSAIGVRPFSLSAWRALLFSAMFAFRVS